MRVNCQSKATVQIEVLGRDQREEMFRAALEITDDPGIDIFNEEALAILESLLRI
jgi:trimethylamine:corrinoid methyltransferase-like protein